MNIAIVYNEPDNGLAERRNFSHPEELGFEPYFDIEESDPVAGFEFMAESLRAEGYNAYTLNIRDDFHTFLSDYARNKPDVVFNLVEIYRNEACIEMCFAGLLELMNIAYTGAPPIALGTCQRKPLTKTILSSLNINTPRYVLVNEAAECSRISLRYPMIVKPSMEDASLGIENDSVVNDYSHLVCRVEYVLTQLHQAALIEEFIDGRELNVAVVGDKKLRALPISEIDFSSMPSYLNHIVSFGAKWDPYFEGYHKTIPICPSVLPRAIEYKAKNIALRAFRALGCRDYARVDIRLSKDNELFVLEVNPNPDLSEGVGFARSAETAGFAYSRTLKLIVDLAYSRFQLRARSHISTLRKNVVL